MTRKLLPSDYHMHTHNSGDSTAPMRDMIESAISCGLTEICFTEHMDLDFPISERDPEGTFTLDIPSYTRELFSYKEEYREKISIKYGIELGLQTQITEENNRIVKDNNFDFVIGSIHLLDHADPFYPEMWEGRDEEDVIRRYFESTLENIRAFSDYDVLGHLDYIVRYTPTKGAGYSYQKYQNEIDAILTHLASNGKGLDLNTKSLTKGGADPNPNADILTRFHELGGRIITFGSDAHIPEDVAGCFERAAEIAISCGFDSYYTFDKRQPIAHPL